MCSQPGGELAHSQVARTTCGVARDRNPARNRPLHRFFGAAVGRGLLVVDTEGGSRSSRKASSGPGSSKADFGRLHRFGGARWSGDGAGAVPESLKPRVKCKRGTALVPRSGVRSRSPALIPEGNGVCATARRGVLLAFGPGNVHGVLSTVRSRNVGGAVLALGPRSVERRSLGLRAKKRRGVYGTRAAHARHSHRGNITCIGVPGPSGQGAPARR